MTIKHKTTASICTIAAILLPATAFAQSNPQNLLQCRQITEDTARLACYDDIASQMNALIGAPDAQPKPSAPSQSAAMPTQPLSKTANEPETEKKGLFRRITGLVGLDNDSADEIQRADADDFGKKKVTTPDENEAVMTIGKVQIFDAIKRRFYMTNGQVWEQKTGVNVHIDEGMQPPGVKAYIEDSGFSGYTMKLNGKGNKIKVKRVL